MPENLTDEQKKELLAQREIEKRERINKITKKWEPRQHEDEEPKKKRKRKAKNKHKKKEYIGAKDTGPNVTLVKEKFGPDKPTVFFATAETLCINESRHASEMLVKAGKIVIDKIMIPFLSKAIVGFRNKDKGLSYEAFEEKFETIVGKIWEAA